VAYRHGCGDQRQRRLARLGPQAQHLGTGQDRRQPNSIAVGYSLSGTAISSGSEPAFFAPFAVAALTDSGSQTWLDALWTKMVNTSFTSNDYYSTSIQLQVMIVVSGNFWAP
jgi:hypothetical protein